MNILGIIPAKSHSNRLPGKNKKLLAGVPLFGYTALQCHSSRLLTEWLVSTDDVDIMAMCDRYGWPFAEQPDFGGDLGKLCLHHAASGSWDAVCLLQPTSPLRHPQDIDAAISLLEAGPEAEAVVGYVDTKHSHTNGAIFLTRFPILPRIPLDGPGVVRYLMPVNRSVDIDTAFDFWLAEKLLTEKPDFASM